MWHIFKNASIKRRKVKLTKAYLTEHYIDKQKSINQIAKENDISPTTVRYNLNKLGIEIKSKKYASNILSKEKLFEEYVTKNLSARDIATKYELHHHSILNLLHKYEIKTRSCSRLNKKNKHLTTQSESKIKKNNKFGLLKAIKWIDHKGWECLCECGQSKIVSSNDLTKKRIKSCGCLRKKTEGFADIPGKFINKCKTGAINRGIKFDITAQSIWELFLKQNKTCALSGIPICFSKKEITASVDRIDSQKGYTIENVQIVHKTVNIMKWSLSQSDFINWCKTIAKFNS